MQEGSPFGWWYGTLEALRHKRNESGEYALATMTFNHFSQSSPWYRLHVHLSDGQMHPCAFGGTTGGMRAVSPQEEINWKRFLPKELLNV
mmetsp:Transcript_50923/g.88413  ORF Transcript_50923/g.88413 Transcript_50923/m.88413 type:complete len:90 (+) Transcript_50923:21-290(+)